MGKETQEIRSAEKIVMKDLPTKQIAERAVREILFDLTDRSGLQNEWDSFDDEVKDEIIAKWQSIVGRAVSEGAL
jgi:hypothetical protein